MITEAEIQSIDYASNSCVIRIPFFETLNTTQDVILSSRFAIQPGIYSGYKAGDVVWVAFEDGQAKNPIVIGKVFKGATDEASNGGAITCSNLEVKSNAKIPDTTFIDTADSKFNTIKKLIENVKNTQLINGIDGLPGGSLSSPLVIQGGYDTKASKIILNNNDAGQITDNGTATLFGFLNKDTPTLTIGSNTYKTNIRGSDTHPTYNNDNLVLMSDISYTNGTENIIGTWIDGKPIYRKAFKYTGDIAYDQEIKIGDINTTLDTIVDLRQTVTHKGMAWNGIYYNLGSSYKGNLTICRVDMNTSQVYVKAASDNVTNTTLIVIVEYTKA